MEAHDLCITVKLHHRVSKFMMLQNLNGQQQQQHTHGLVHHHVDLTVLLTRNASEMEYHPLGFLDY